MNLTHGIHHVDVDVLTYSVPFRASSTCHLSICPKKSNMISIQCAARSVYLCHRLRSKTGSRQIHHKTCNYLPLCQCSRQDHLLKYNKRYSNVKTLKMLFKSCRKELREPPERPERKTCERPERGLRET